MKNTIFTGAGVAIITPMNADGSINYDGFAENICGYLPDFPHRVQ